ARTSELAGSSLAPQHHFTALERVSSWPGFLPPRSGCARDHLVKEHLMFPFRVRTRPVISSRTRRVQPRKTYRPNFALLVDSSLLSKNTVSLAVAPTLASQVVQGFYQEMLGRTPQPAEISHWVNELNSGLTLDRLAQAFLSSPEYDSFQVQKEYTNLLGRQPETGIISTWVRAIQASGALQVFNPGELASQQH